jgi:hypothetical protein
MDVPPHTRLDLVVVARWWAPPEHAGGARQFMCG